jgi:hypothetical protein
VVATEVVVSVHEQALETRTLHDQGVEGDLIVFDSREGIDEIWKLTRDILWEMT